MHVSSEADSQEMIKADKMIHVSVRDKDISNLEDLSRLKSIYFPDVEEGSFTSVLEFYIDPGIG